MELKEVDCPFCDTITDWMVSGVEFVGSEVYMSTSCPKCGKKIVVSVPVVFNQMRMFVTPKSKNVQAKMLSQDEIKEKQIETVETTVKTTE